MAATIINTFTQARSLFSNTHFLILRGGHWVCCSETNVLSRVGRDGHRSRITSVMKEQVMWWGWRVRMEHVLHDEGAGTPTLELSCECEEGWRGDYWEGAQLHLHGLSSPSVSCLHLCMSIAELCRLSCV